jgi:elongation factor 3
MLLKADILLLDEPTNHLDVKNVAWLENYLTTIPTTSMIVSHDSGFLDRVCTNIVHYESNLKLKSYVGNLSEFVKKRPEAKAYYELASENTAFRFPEPGFLEGVKNKSKAILKMYNCTFQYPGTPKPQVNNASLFVSLSSRVSCVGPNGAGKSTMIKILTGELLPDTGKVERHAAMRIAYVAQHAFHHLDRHSTKSPNEYLQWRFALGEDREGMDRASRQATPEEEAKMKAKYLHDGEKKVVERIHGRRNAKRGFEYEVSWVGKSMDDNSYIDSDTLCMWGFEKELMRIDERVAAQQSMHSKPLTRESIAKHLADIGLEEEFSVHSRIKGLSGGQKVKVVLGGAMWQNPHVVVMDEPTNYLDRDSLGALACAIREFGGGVVLISHNAQFTDALAQEKWSVENGELTITGQPSMFGGEKLEWKPEEDTVDAAGNTVKAKKQKKTTLTRKEKMAKEKRRKARVAAGEEDYDSDDSDYQ